MADLPATGSTSPLTIDLDGVIGTIGIDDGKVNALTHQVFADIGRALDDHLAAARVIVLHGRPGVLSAGLHLPTMREGGAGADELRRLGIELIVRLFELDRPLVIGCTGHALAFSAGLLCVGDVRCGAAGDHRIGFNEVAAGVGFGPPIAEIARYRMAATHYDGIIRGEVMSPVEAVAAGLLDVVVSPEKVIEEAHSAAERLAALEPAAYQAAKRSARGPTVRTIRAALEGRT